MGVLKEYSIRDNSDNMHLPLPSSLYISSNMFQLSTIHQIDPKVGSRFINDN